MSAKRSYRAETELVHAGILRSQFGETSEALFLTQGYVYESSTSAEKRFKNEEPGYQYSRFSNPTVTMFEQRMTALEGAEAARATATGMAAVTTALMGQVRAGDTAAPDQSDAKFAFLFCHWGLIVLLLGAGCRPVCAPITGLSRRQALPVPARQRPIIRLTPRRLLLFPPGGRQNREAVRKRCPPGNAEVI